jgi:hypothetical protein
MCFKNKIRCSSNFISRTLFSPKHFHERDQLWEPLTVQLHDHSCTVCIAATGYLYTFIDNNNNYLCLRGHASLFCHYYLFVSMNINCCYYLHTRNSLLMCFFGRGSVPCFHDITHYWCSLSVCLWVVQVFPWQWPVICVWIE